MSAKRTCSIEGCENGGKITRGWCKSHYDRWYRHGDPLWQRSTPEERFWANVDRHGPDGFHSQTGENLGPCWLWTAAPYDGYGRLKVDGGMVLTHRFSYDLQVGPIPDGLQLDHLCRVTLCVNPYHLEPVTHRENTMRGATFPARQAAKTHCPQGHEYSPENTKVYRGSRYCRACRPAHGAAYRARRSAS
jgi:hypothetical protein